MLQMMSDLLEAGRRGQSPVDLETERVDYAQLVRGVLSDLETELAENGSTIDLDSDHVPGRVDRVRFEQIVSNLVSNAIKYGEGEPIDVMLSHEGDAVERLVRDRGVGIPPELQDVIFDRFKRIDEKVGTDGESDSFGLGLWIVKRAVDALGGTIEVDSTVGEGTEFRVRVPRIVDENED